MSINVVTFSGNLGSDCVTRSTPNGKVIATFSLPVKQGYGEHEKVTWVQCRILGTRAEKLARYLTKGTKVIVTGQHLLESWTSKDGTEKSTSVAIVDQIDFTSKQDGQSQQSKPPVSNEASPPFDDDVPF